MSSKSDKMMSNRYVSKCGNTLKFYILKTLLNKNSSISFFSSSDLQKFHHLLGSIGINSSVFFFKCFALSMFNKLLKKLS